MKRDAEAHAEDDKKKRGLVDARNMADALIVTAERAMKDAGDKITDELKTSINEKISTLRKVKDTGSIEEIRTASEALGAEIQKIGPAMGAGHEPTQPPPPNS